MCKKGRQQGYFDLQRHKNRQQRLHQKRLSQQRKRLWQMPPQSLVLRCGKQIQKIRRQHSQTPVRQDAPQTQQRQKLHPIFNQTPKLNR